MLQTNKDKALLILDLDETLIHSSANELGRPCDLKIFDFFVYKRPWLPSFLTEAFIKYKIAIWSTGSDDYVEKLSDSILPEGFRFDFVWGRSRCTARRSGHGEMYSGYTDPGQVDYIKSIKKLRKKGYSRSRILIVDDSPYKLSDNYGNAIYVSEYTGNIEDDELRRLSEYLKKIADVPDFRTLEKRGWRESL
jgi:RNA polymerase II subunit A small phosphatase-like protein